MRYCDEIGNNQIDIEKDHGYYSKGLCREGLLRRPDGAVIPCGDKKEGNECAEKSPHLPKLDLVKPPLKQLSD